MKMASTIAVTPRIVGPSSFSLHKSPHQTNQYSASNSLKFSHGSNPKYNYSNLRPLTITRRSVRCAATGLIQDAFANAVKSFHDFDFKLKTTIDKLFKDRFVILKIFFYDEDGRVKNQLDRIISKKKPKGTDEVHKCIDCLLENNADRCIFSMSYVSRGVLGYVIAAWKTSEIIRASLEYEDTEVTSSSSSSSSSNMVVNCTQLVLVILDLDEKVVIDESGFGGIRSREDLRDLLQFLNSPELELAAGTGLCYTLKASKEKHDKIKGGYTHLFV